MKNLSISLIILFISTIAIAQETDQPRLKVSTFSGSFGFAGVNVSNTKADYNSLRGNVEDSDIFIDLDDATESQYNYGFGGNGNARFYLGFTPYSKKKGKYRENQELRFSLGTSFGVRRTFNYYSINDTRLDTLQSNSGQNQVFADSSVYNRYFYTENFYDISIGVAYLFRSDIQRRFHFHAGGGLEYGIGIRSFVRFDNYREESVIYYDPANPPVQEEDDFFFFDRENDGVKTSSTTNMNGNLMFLRAYIPFGINFRIARKPQSFFHNVFLFTEAMPGIEFQMVGNEKTYVNPYFGVAMLGFTYRW